MLLLGTADAAKSIPDKPSEQPLLVQDIAAGSPSSLIERRPDILAAEHGLQARNADIGAARAAFFPRITLTGSFGAPLPKMLTVMIGSRLAGMYKIIAVISKAQVRLILFGRRACNTALHRLQRGDCSWLAGLS